MIQIHLEFKHQIPKKPGGAYAPPYVYTVFVDQTMLDLMKYCRKQTNWTQMMQSGEARGAQGRPGEARRGQELPEGFQDDSNSPLEFKHQNTAQKAWEAYAPPYVYIVFFT